MWFLHLSPFACEFLPWTTGILDSRTWCPLKASSGRCVMAPIESTWIWTWRKSNQGVSWWISRGQEPTDWYTIFTNNDKQKGCEWIFIIHQSQSLCTFGWVRSWWDHDMSLSIWKRFIMKTNTSSEGTGFFKMISGKLAVQAETISRKNLLETGCKHPNFFQRSKWFMLFSYQEFTQLLRFGHLSSHWCWRYIYLADVFARF